MRSGKTLAVALLALSPAAVADMVFMKNGDRISGEVKRIWDGDLFIDPEYGDEFSVELVQVLRIESDREFEVELPDHSEITGRFSTNAQGDPVFLSESSSRPLTPQDIEELEEPEDFFDWSLRSDLSWSLSRGNTRTDNLLWQADGNIKLGDHRHELDLRYDRQEQESVLNKEQQNALYLYSWFFTDPWFFAAGVGYERDPIRGLTSRITPGLGLGYQVFEDANRLLEVSLAAVQVRESIGGESNESTAARWQLTFRRDVTSDLEFFHDHLVLSNLDGRDNLVADTETGIRWEIWSDVFFNVQLNWNWESDPALGNEQEDLTYALGLGLELD
ncbi:MAG: DUF481 domain-containing protein [Pseudomonadota bacterium]